MKKLTVLSGAAAALVAGAASAGGGLAPWIDQGWYNSLGVHSTTNTNYITGKLGADIYHNFGVFDLSSFSGQAVAATVSIFQPSGGFSGPDAVYNMWTYEGSISDLVNATGNTLNTFADLANGSMIASINIGAGTNGTTVNINLNAAGLAYLTSKFGGQVALGGALVYDGQQANHYSFGFSGAAQWQLFIDTEIPAPGALALLGLAGVTARRRRRA